MTPHAMSPARLDATEAHLRQTFKADTDAHDAVFRSIRFDTENGAVAWLIDCGFSVGRMQAGAPRGLMFGRFDVQKWRNLSKADVIALHGRMTAQRGGGPAEIRFSPSLPAEAVSAVKAGMVRRIARETAAARAMPTGAGEA